MLTMLSAARGSKSPYLGCSQHNPQPSLQPTSGVGGLVLSRILVAKRPQSPFLNGAFHIHEMHAENMPWRSYQRRKATLTATVSDSPIHQRSCLWKASTPTDAHFSKKRVMLLLWQHSQGNSVWQREWCSSLDCTEILQRVNKYGSVLVASTAAIVVNGINQPKEIKTKAVENRRTALLLDVKFGGHRKEKL